MGKKFYGKNGIYAEVIQHSADENDPRNEVLTISVKYWLGVHSEALRHRQWGRGVKSNRAIPMKTIRREVLTDPYVPVWFGAAEKGMVANVEMGCKGLARQLWLKSRYLMCGVHWIAEKMGAHKEWGNRLLNPWQFVRETITATEWDNFFALRLDKSAQKDIKELADCIYRAKLHSEPFLLKSGEYHVPYVERIWADGELLYYSTGVVTDEVGNLALQYTQLTLEEAIRCSAARCARSSYDNHDGTSPKVERDLELYHDLITSAPTHASPVEHPCTPMKVATLKRGGVGEEGDILNISDIFDEGGVTHIDSKLRKWSGNLKGFIQFRQTLPNHTCEKYIKGD